MYRSDIINLINNDDEVLFLEIFRRAKMQLERVVTIESESCLIPNTSNETKPLKTDLEKINLSHKNSSELTRKKHLTFRKDKVHFKILLVSK